MILFDVYEGSERLGSVMLSSDADLMIQGLKDGTFWSYRGDTNRRINLFKVRSTKIKRSFK